MDAAVAAAFTSFVAEIYVVNIGGGGYALICDGGQSCAYDFFTGVPSRGNPETYDFRKIRVDFIDDSQSFFIGRASSAVPGVMLGLTTMAQEKGRLPLKILMEPAIQLARNGFTISPHFTNVFDMLKPIFADTPGLRAMFSKQGNFCKEGDSISFPNLADSFEALALAGPDLFYKGQFAEMIAQDHRLHNGRISYQDLVDYRVHETEPLTVDYHGHQVLLPPPSSIGGSLIGFALKLLSRVSFQKVEHNSFEHIEPLAHVMRLANKARTFWESLPAGDERASFFLSDTFLAPYHQQLELLLSGGVIEPETESPHSRAGNTSHISAIDVQGMAVSITTTAGENSGYAVADTGICLNNILGESDLNPHGFHIQTPGERMMSMMSPTIVCRDGEPVLALGSAGSNRIRSAILQVIINVIDFGALPQLAVNMPRVHHEGGILHLEQAVQQSVAQRLDRAGFEVNHWSRKHLYFGGAQAVQRGKAGIHGGGDDRRGGWVSGLK